MSLRSKVDRAIAAYAAGLGVASHVYTAIGEDYMNLTVQIERKVVDGPTLTVKTHNGSRTSPYVGNYKFHVMLQILGTAIVQPNANNAAQARIAIDEVTDAVYNAFMQANVGERDLRATATAITAAGRALAVDFSAGADPVQVLRASNNADMANFTLIQWSDAGMAGGNPATEGGKDTTNFIEVLNFEATACGSNVD